MSFICPPIARYLSRLVFAGRGQVTTNGVGIQCPLCYGKGFGGRPGASDRPGIGAGVGKPPVQPRVMALGPNTAKELAGRGCSRRGRGRVIHYPVIRDLDARATAGFKVDLS